jgi:hypothetical protein
MTPYHLAQFNIARALADLDDPLLADFMAQLDEINALAEESPGFVWRLQTDSGNATDIQVSDDPRLLVNMSVWGSAKALFDYVYKSGHAKVMARRREWFERSGKPYLVLWWVSAGHRPTVEEALERLAELERNGPSPRAFTFKQRFPPPSGAAGHDLSDEEVAQAKCA